MIMTAKGHPSSSPRQWSPRNNSQTVKKKYRFLAWTLFAVLFFLLGAIVSGSLILYFVVDRHYEEGRSLDQRISSSGLQKNILTTRASYSPMTCADYEGNSSSSNNNNNSRTSPHHILQGLRVLVFIASYDLSQLPHLEEVLDALHDLAMSGCQQVQVRIDTTVPYPVPFVDMLNDRFPAPQFNLQIVLQPPSLRMNLVDAHRPFFYNHLDDYDVFLYTEDDHRITPTNVAAYVYETRRIECLLKKQKVASYVDANDHNRTRFYQPSDFNVGIVRYEYNWPSHVVMSDDTRHLTENVTRVYWEQSVASRWNNVSDQNQSQPVPDAAQAVPQDPLSPHYVTMTNQHQGMYLATASLLRAWRERPQCHFDQVRNIPMDRQVVVSTQRVWMSSMMLYGREDCNVQQVLPMHRFGTLTVMHLPNKNYRRVGGVFLAQNWNLTYEQDNKNETTPLVTALDMHVALKRAYPPLPQQPYQGVDMVDNVPRGKEKTKLMLQRIQDFQAYKKRGGVLSEKDMRDTDLLGMEYRQQRLRRMKEEQIWKKTFNEAMEKAKAQGHVLGAHKAVKLNLPGFKLPRKH